MPILSSFLQQLLNVNEHLKVDQTQTDPASQLIMSEIWVGKRISYNHLSSEDTKEKDRLKVEKSESATKH